MKIIFVIFFETELRIYKKQGRGTRENVEFY